jgi:hypothetical protein
MAALKPNPRVNRRFAGPLDGMSKDVKVDRSQFRLDRRRVDALPREVLVAELRRVAELLGGRRFSRRDFDRHATACKGSVVLSHFGSWYAALNSIGIPLKDYRSDRKQITDAQLLEELARVWSGIGHRPSKLEWEAGRCLLLHHLQAEIWWMGERLRCARQWGHRHQAACRHGTQVRTNNEAST